jgi:hypothetical protein
MFARLFFSQKCRRGFTSPRLRGEVGAQRRVRGPLSMGGARDRNVVGALNHRCRVAFSGAPSPGARAFHARTIAEALLRRPSPRTAAEGGLCSPRARGEVRERPRHAKIFPGQPCRRRGEVNPVELLREKTREHFSVPTRSERKTLDRTKDLLQIAIVSPDSPPPAGAASLGPGFYSRSLISGFSCKTAVNSEL